MAYDFLPRILPTGWRVAEKRRDGAAYINDNRRLSVIVSATLQLDGKKWLHVSCAHPHRLPTWETLKDVKMIFIGRKRQALQVLPSEEKWISIHPYCLHLFCCLDKADPVPDFTQGGITL